MLQDVEPTSPGAVVEGAQVGLDYACPHQVNPGQEHPIHVQQRLDPRWLLALEQLPLPGGKPAIVTLVTARHAVGGDRLQLLVRRRGAHDQRRVHLFKHVPVRLQQQTEELARVVGHQIDLHPGKLVRRLDGIAAAVETDDVLQRQQMDAAQIAVGVRGRKPVQMGAADGDEQQRMRLPVHQPLHARVAGELRARGRRAHGSRSSTARRRAWIRNRSARS